ncbi:conjugal transfer protein TraA [Acetobacter malorum]|uniref:Conjugal transfer protein TraA n=1 Tax=Acetobacter malorum TaxID=178901 RepID=A0A177GA98_9PROT|nr:conjugal transfer protein TraA [Acetobacter malorum]
MRQQALRDARERAVREAKERMTDIAKRAQRLPPDAREQFLAGEYPSDPFDRALKAHSHPLGTAGLDAEEKAVRAHLKVYQVQEKRQQAERVQVPTQGRGRGGPSRSRSRDYDRGPDFF